MISTIPPAISRTQRKSISFLVCKGRTIASRSAQKLVMQNDEISSHVNKRQFSSVSNIFYLGLVLTYLASFSYGSAYGSAYSSLKLVARPVSRSTNPPDSGSLWNSSSVQLDFTFEKAAECNEQPWQPTWQLLMMKQINKLMMKRFKALRKVSKILFSGSNFGPEHQGSQIRRERERAKFLIKNRF